MNLTPEQFTKCREDYESWLISTRGTNSAGIPINEDKHMFESWQAAWRPIPSVKEIMKALEIANIEYIRVGSHRSFDLFIAQAIHRAFGGEDER